MNSVVLIFSNSFNDGFFAFAMYANSAAIALDILVFFTKFFWIEVIIVFVFLKMVSAYILLEIES